MIKNNILYTYNKMVNNLENETLKKLFKEKIASNENLIIDEELRYISGILAHVPLSNKDFKILQTTYKHLLENSK